MCVLYDGPEGPLFSSMVSYEVFLESDIVLRSVKQVKVSREFLDSSFMCQRVLGSFKQFSDSLNSTRRSQAVFGTLKQFSEFLNSSWNSRTVLGILKYLLEFLNSSQKSQTLFQTLFCLNHFMLITFDNEVWLCRYYPLKLDNIFKLSFIIVVVVVFISFFS